MAASTEVLTQVAAYLDFRNESTLLWVIFKSAKTLRSEPSFSTTASKYHFRLFTLKASEQCCPEEKVPCWRVRGCFSRVYCNVTYKSNSKLVCNLLCFGQDVESKVA